MTEENQGFTISDRRIKEDEPGGETKPATGPKKENTEAGSHDAIQGEKTRVDFQGFILSLGTTALVHLGEPPFPGTEKAPANLPHAQEMIDILSLLQDKTKGNLTQEENRLLSNLLYTLRMKFVEISKK
ncbi:MAG TPA: DUF1844 domain-containing protein [Nitrospiria bacterium]|nr:DUF1844 domain-containing protein [Nitrospiria bacterium]